MPPRYSYWTILAGGLPTAFRAAERADLLPTFNRIREKHPDAEMKWFARGRLWISPAEAQADLERARVRRDRDWRPGGEHRDPRQRVKTPRTRERAQRESKPGRPPRDQKPEWSPREPRPGRSFRDQKPAGSVGKQHTDRSWQKRKPSQPLREQRSDRSFRDENPRPPSARRGPSAGRPAPGKRQR
jgi:hypothetical protein